MVRGIYTNGTGMIGLQRQLEVTTHNLANLNTTGFKRSSLEFRESMRQTLAADGGRGPVVGSLSAGSLPGAQRWHWEVGSITKTANPLDFAVDTDLGLFAVRDGDGIAYTRDGAFALSDDGMLVDKKGRQVLDAELNPIQVPQGRIEGSPDGTLSVNGIAAGRIGVFVGNFRPQGSNLWTAADAQPVAREQVRLRPGALEGSNVNAIEAMLEMITVNRNFELSQKSITSQDELTQRLISSLQPR